jgi:hypothetical protein
MKSLRKVTNGNLRAEGEKSGEGRRERDDDGPERGIKRTNDPN